MDLPSNRTHAATLELAHLYRDCVECFGLIHQGRKEWDRAQRLLLTRLGIQQARLLAYGQIMGICELGEGRDPRLDEQVTRDSIMNSLKGIIERPRTLDRVAQFDKYGLKPSKKLVEPNEPSLDSTRLEAFREQYMSLDAARTPSATANHWMIADDVKFRAFITDAKSCVDSLISTVGIQERVDKAVKSDIKALGWHPVFCREKAASDSSKLRLIKDSCIEDYPEYSAETTGALAYLNKQWQDFYEDCMNSLDSRVNPYRLPKTTSPKSNGKVSAAEHRKSHTKATKDPQKHKRLSIFSFLRSSKKRHSITSVPDDKQTSLSHSPDNTEEHPSMEPERSQSDSAVGAAIGRNEHKFEFSNPFSEELARLETSKSPQDQPVETVQSLVSRHDQLPASI